MIVFFHQICHGLILSDRNNFKFIDYIYMLNCRCDGRITLRRIDPQSLPYISTCLKSLIRLFVCWSPSLGSFEGLSTFWSRNNITIVISKSCFIYLGNICAESGCLATRHLLTPVISDMYHCDISRQVLFYFYATYKRVLLLYLIRKWHTNCKTSTLIMNTLWLMTN